MLVFTYLCVLNGNSSKSPIEILLSNVNRSTEATEV